MQYLKKYILLLLSLVLIIGGFLTESILLNGKQKELAVQKFEAKLQQQQALLDQSLDILADSIEHNNFNIQFQTSLNELLPHYNKEGIGFLITEKQKLVYWSGNQFAFPEAYLSPSSSKQLLYLPNGTYLSTTKIIENYSIIGLIHIKDSYSIENEFIENSFSDVFEIAEEYSIQIEQTEYSLPVYDAEGNYLLSVISDGTIYCQISNLYLPSVLFALGLLFLLLFARKIFRNYNHINFIIRSTILSLSLIGLYWAHIVFKLPAFCNAFDLFSPSLYAYSAWLPSLGDLLLLSSLIFFLSLNIAKDLVFSKKKKYYELIIAYSFVALLYLAINFLTQNLIRNSSFSFQLNRIDDINQYSFVGYLIIALLFFSAFIVNMRVVEFSNTHIPKKKFLFIHAILILLCIVLSIIYKNTFLYTILLFLTTNFLVIILQKTQLKRFSPSYLILFVSIFTFFSLIIIQNNNNARQQNLQELMAYTLNSEQDPAAVDYLSKIQQQIDVDSRIPELLFSSYSELDQYIKSQYFNGYFQKYDLQVTICESTDSLLIQPDNQLVLCYPFFEDMIENSGTQIPGTNFYHMDNMNGRISYFGKLFYPLASNSSGISIFLELQSKLQSEGEGFPELLIDKSLKKPDSYQNFSYAKYYDNTLVHLSGDYQYNYYISSYGVDENSPEFVIKEWDDYDHLIYNAGNNSYIIVSEESFTILDYLISFPYLFVFFLIFSFAVVFTTSADYRNHAFVIDLRFKIQASIIMVVLLSLLVVAASTIYYNILEYNNKHEENLNEKMQSISEEVDLRLNNMDDISKETQDWLWIELSDLSNIFRADINIYNIEGEMIASSRPEITSLKIISTRMNAQAFYELSENLQISFVQPEEIGNLSYLSIYEPIINYKGEYLGFINLPYFSHENDLKQEVSTFIVAFINLYVFLFFASVIIAVLLSNQITRPLTLIREKLKGIKLNEKNEQITYQHDDEIGELVKEYNRKVEELADSANILARTEREMAWREMAKQIAHEIKNPLTPMKLSIQYLQKKKAENSEHYDEYFNRVTRTLIEQINTLSDIATEFSNFAKIPNAKNEIFDLKERLLNVAELFKPNKKMDFHLDLEGNKDVLIFADPEQLSRALINLVKNAMQSVPPNRRIEINIRLERNDTHATIAIQDNGTGIPEQIRLQLFQPNFTTKSSGMGLGLAIVKNIVETCRGQIWFETKIDKGTTFFIEIPLYFENSSSAPPGTIQK